MKHDLAVLLLCWLAAMGAAVAQESSAEARVEQKLAPGGTVRMQLASGDYEISGSDTNAIVVTYHAATAARTKKVKVELKAGDSGAQLTIEDTPHSNFHARIEVPRRVDLWLRLTAGNLKVEDVEGDKDIEAHAGNVDVSIPRSEEYGHRDASVLAGNVDATAFGVSKSGLWRSFEQGGPGKYRLHVHVGAGNVTLSPTI